MEHRALLVGYFISAHVIPLVLIVLAGASLFSRDIRQFVRAVSKHWITLMSGVLGLLATVIAQIRGVEIGTFSDYVAIGFFAIGCACFLAWRGERAETETERTRTEEERAAKKELADQLADPIFEGNLLAGSTWSKGPSPDSTRLKCLVRVRNAGIVPSTVSDWMLVVPFPDRLAYIGPEPEFILSPNVVMTGERRSEGIKDHPAIQRGDARDFEIYFLIPFSLQGLKTNVCDWSITLDVKNKPHFIAWPIP